jgi:hypothetical protein
MELRRKEMLRLTVQLLLSISTLLLAIIFVAPSANIAVQAEPAATQVFSANARTYLPIVHGPGQAALATPTISPTPTYTPLPTNTPESGRLASPTLFDILNNDYDGNFEVGWSIVADAEYYKLEQKKNSDPWKQIYEGPQQELSVNEPADGQYCYRVMASNFDADSEWSTMKCTAVINVTSTPEPGGLAIPILSNIENEDGDGSFVVKWSAVPDADEYILREGVNGAEDSIVYRGSKTSFSRSVLTNGQYCYRVRAVQLGGEWSPWSEIKCITVTGTSAPLHCSFAMVGRITPGIAGHQMTYLQQKNIVVITGGFFSEEGGDYGVSGYQDDIYVYDVNKVRLYFAGKLQIPRYRHSAIALDNSRILLIGGYSDKDSALDDEIIYIERSLDGDGYRASSNTVAPAFDSPIDATPLDLEKALVLTYYRDNIKRIWLYHTTTGEKELVGSFEDPNPWDWATELEPMNKSGTKILARSIQGAFIIDTIADSSNYLAYPLVDDYGELFRRFDPEVVLLDNNNILLTNGWYDDGPWPFEAWDAFILNDEGTKKKLDDTNYGLYSRIALKTQDGYVLLISGLGYADRVTEYSLGTEVYDPKTEMFFVVDRPHSPHADGEGIRLSDGNSFVISGGYDDYWDPGDFEPTTADLVELVTCK